MYKLTTKYSRVIFNNYKYEPDFFVENRIWKDVHKNTRFTLLIGGWAPDEFHKLDEQIRRIKESFHSKAEDIRDVLEKKIFDSIGAVV